MQIRRKLNQDKIDEVKQAIGAMQAEYDAKMKEKKQQCEFKSVRKEISKAVLLRSQMKESRSVRSLSGL